MRTVWKGYLKISMVTIPIKLYNATSSRRSIAFNLLHEKDKGRIKQQRVCTQCDQVLSADELVKGYRYGKEMYVVLTDEDFKKAEKESSEAIEILKFVTGEQIDPIYYTNSHYIVPEGKIGLESFALIHKAMEKTGKSALAKVVIRKKEQLLCLAPYNGTLIAYTLHYPEEINDVKKVEPAGLEKVKIDDRSMELAENIIENLTGDFEPEEFTDEYNEILMKIIKAKAEGEEFEVVSEEEVKKVGNLMSALEQSVEQTATAPRKDMASAGKRQKKGKKKEEAKEQKKGKKKA